MKHILVLFSMSLLISITGFSQPSDSGQGYQIGSKVNDFEMNNIDGKSYSLKSIEDTKGYIVIFTSNMCPFAVAYEDRIIELHNKMAPKGYPVVAINSNDGSGDSGDSFKDMVVRYREKNFPFLYLRDKEGEYKKFGANKTPHVFLLDNELIVRYIGAIDDSPREPAEVEEKFVENAIMALEKGETPSPETTKAIGCPIKAKGAGGKKGGSKGDRRGPPPADQIMKQMDKNNDQKISKDEAHGPLVRDFDRIDQNQDGVLTMEELKNMKKK